MGSLKYVDIVLVKAQVDNGKLKTSIDRFGNILLEDTTAGEAVKLGVLPDGYSFHAKGNWLPCYMYTSNSIDTPMSGEDGWKCSECGYTAKDRHDWCPDCGADMRKPKKTNKKLMELLEEL